MKNIGHSVILAITSVSGTRFLKDTSKLFGMALIFPAQAWVGLKNIGTDNIRLVLIFSVAGFEKNMRCGSVMAGQTAPPINPDELKACAHEGHVEQEALAPAVKNIVRRGHPHGRTQ